MLELKQLTKIGTISKFWFEFSRLLTQCNLTTVQVISCFLGGLKDELVGTMLIHEPETLSKVIKLSRLIESTQLAKARSQEHMEYKEE